MKIRGTEQEGYYREGVEQYFDNSELATSTKLENFMKYISRQTVAHFLFRYEIFKKVLDVHGSVAECGVYQGNGLLTWAVLSAIFEPYNYQRKIIGFDTFEGFPEISDEDRETLDKSSAPKVGEFRVEGIYEDIKKGIALYDLNRPNSHIEKIELVKGDANGTFKDYLNKNPHLVISLLYLDFDLYKPTKSVLELAISRIPKGGIIAFDELNHVQWPGETKAVTEVLGLDKIKLQRFSFEPCRSYAVIE